MSIIAEFTVPAEQFALYETLCRATEMVVEVERVVTHGPDHLMPYFWTASGDYETFERAARNDPSVDALTKLDELDDAVLYRAKWIQDVESVVYAYTETGAILLDATGRDERWELQLRFDTEADVTQFKVVRRRGGVRHRPHATVPTLASDVGVTLPAHGNTTGNPRRRVTVGLLRGPARNHPERVGHGVRDLATGALEAVSQGPSNVGRKRGDRHAAGRLSSRRAKGSQSRVRR